MPIPLCVRTDQYRRQRNVALKIPTGDSTEREVQVLRALRQRLHESSGSKHVTQLSDDFKMVGPNGTHGCLVLELLGPSISALLRGPCSEDHRLKAPMARRISRDVILGLDCLHRNGVVHGGMISSVVPLRPHGIVVISMYI